MKNNLVRLFAALCLALGLSGAFPASPARAATLTVTNCNDSGDGSLRKAMTDAAEGDTITFGLDCSASAPITLASSLPSIGWNGTISGAGHEIVIDGNHAVRIFTINWDYTVTLEYLTLINGVNSDGGNGGAIYDNGSFLTLSHMTFDGNQAAGDSNRDGGAIYHSTHGSLTIANSTFTNNSTTRYGGAIDAHVDTAITDSTFTNNSAFRGGGVDSYASITLSLERVTMNGNTAIGPESTSGQGGAIYFGFGTLNINNSTLSGNGSSEYTTYGGAIYTYDSTVTIKNSTIASNNISDDDPGFSGGGLYINDATLNYYNTILANNAVDDCGTSSGLTVANNVNNLVEVSSSCGVPASTSDPLLDPLQDNGGSTQTMALTAGSPAIDAGDDTTCLDTDQRGSTRPSGVHCDIGAYELAQLVTLTVATSGAGSGVVTSTPAGIDCGSDCSEAYEYNTDVTLTAAASLGSTFTGWDGACSGTGNCTVTMDAAKSVTAAFTLKTYSISGNVKAGGVTLTYTDGTVKHVTSASNGNYTIKVPYGWSGTVTPSKTGYTFTPTKRTYTNVTTNKTGQNYTVKIKTTFKSIASQDGWILESSETSGKGGTLNNAATTFQLGDNKQKRQYRAILSFNTASLPDNAIIQSAVLKIKRSGSPVGSNPFNVLGSLYADIRKGFFGSSSALQLTDFNAAASASKVGIFGKTPVSGWYTATLTSSGRNNINKTNLTQFRLYFSKDDNNNSVADYMKFFSGNYSTATARPQLIITYTLP